MFSTPARRLARWLITGDLPALGTSLLLCLPVGGATVVTAQRIGAWLAGSLLKIALLHIALLCRLRDPFLLSLGDCLAILPLLSTRPLRGLRFGIVTAVVITLGNLLQLLIRCLTLGVSRARTRRLRECFPRRFFHLAQGCLTLAITVDRSLLGRT